MSTSTRARTTTFMDSTIGSPQGCVKREGCVVSVDAAGAQGVGAG
jgi:hypothetical protein